MMTTKMLNIVMMITMMKISLMVTMIKLSILSTGCGWDMMTTMVLNVHDDGDYDQEDHDDGDDGDDDGEDLNDDGDDDEVVYSLNGLWVQCWPAGSSQSHEAGRSRSPDGGQR